MSANAMANAGNIIMQANALQEKPLILIPAYNPDQDLITLVDGLINMGFDKILIVDDGSEQASQWVFDKLLDYPYCIIYKHEKNKGKGAAVKTGLAHFIGDFPDYDLLITTNADGYHSLEAIESVTLSAMKNTDSLVLGVKDFSKINLPLHNRLGKWISEKMIYFFLPQDILDIQTGLRGISRKFASTFMALAGESSDYETNMVLQCQQSEIPIKQVPIKTPFFKKKKGENFHPVLEALKMYWQFIKYIIVALLTTIIDVTTFMLFVALFIDASPNNYILYATVVSRIISLLFNYILNHKTVFHPYSGTLQTFLKYALICAVNILASAYLVKAIYLLTNMHMNLALIKILVSFLLFFFNYYLQKKWVFRTKTR